MYRGGKIKLIEKNNTGVSDSRNVGIDASKGQYIMFLDSDDTISSDYLQKHISAIIRSNADLIISNSRKSGLFKYSEIYNDRTIVFATPWCKLFKSDIIKQNHIRFNTKLNLCEDWCFVMDYISIADKIALIDYSGYNWNRSNNESLSQGVSYENRLSAYDVALSHLKNLWIKKGLVDEGLINRIKLQNWNTAITQMYAHNIPPKLRLSRISDYLKAINGSNRYIDCLSFDINSRLNLIEQRLKLVIKSCLKSLHLVR